MVTFTIPQVFSWKRPRVRVAGGKAVVFADPETRHHTDYVALLARAALPDIQGRYAVRVMVHTANRRNRDLDRVLNGVLDGLVKSGRVGDDRLCWDQSIKRCITRDRERIEVCVWAIDDEG